MAHLRRLNGSPPTWLSLKRLGDSGSLAFTTCDSCCGLRIEYLCDNFKTLTGDNNNHGLLGLLGLLALAGLACRIGLGTEMTDPRLCCSNSKFGNLDNVSFL